MHGRWRSEWFCMLACLCVLLSGCMVGPDFHSPSSPYVKTYTKSSRTVSISHAGSAGRAQVFIYGKDIPAAWWKLFHSKEINCLVALGITNSPNMMSAQAKLKQAQETLNVQRGTLLWPALNAQLSGNRQRFSPAAFGGTSFGSTVFNLFNASVNVSYTLDVFGGAHRQVEAAQAQVDYQRYQMIGTYLTLTSNIVTTAITIASIESQIKALHELIRAEEDQLHIIEKQFQLGGVSNENVLSQQTVLAQDRALLPPLEKSLAQSQHALAILIGAIPGQSQLPQITLENIRLPSRLPVSLPSLLVRNRPDVQAQEALLHQASAQIGVATANLLPQVSLSGNYGWESNVVNQLLSPFAKTWLYGTTLTQPIFQGWSLLAQRRANIAAYESAYGQYRQTVLQAFGNVADSLRALQEDARAFRAQRQAEIALKRTLSLTRQQYHLGGVSYLAMLSAKIQYQQTLMNRIQAQGLRYNDTVALFQSLGGGWWNRQELCE